MLTEQVNSQVLGKSTSSGLKKPQSERLLSSRDQALSANAYYSETSSTSERPYQGSEEIEQRLKRRATRRETRMLRATYSFHLEEEEEPDFVRDIQKTLDDQKITAQDLLVQDKEFNDSELKVNSRWASERNQYDPPPPSGGVRITPSKYWVPKTINPMVIQMRKYQLKELKDAYDFLEDHKTGMVDVRDVATIVRACGFEPKHGEVADILDRINLYSPGSLSLEEFNQVFEYKLDQKDPLQEIERAFKLMDLSKTGKVTMEDMRRVSKLVDYEVNDEELQQMIDQALPTPEGDASMNGFVHLMTQKQYYDEPTKVKPKKTPLIQEKKKYRKSYRSKSILPLTTDHSRSKSNVAMDNFATIVQM